MAYDGKIMRRALEQFDADRRQRQEEFHRRQTALYLREPRLREIDAELRSTVSRIVVSALRRGTDPRPALGALRERNLALQEERAGVLRRLGLPEDALEEKPACPLCGDTGYRDGEVCRCLRAYYVRAQKKELSRMLDLGRQSFDTFSMDWYSEEPDPAYGMSPRENMEAVYDVCAEYAGHFADHGGNLLLCGAPGLGKTFLSAAIAREVNEAGFSVVYDTAAHVFDRFEARKFGRDEDAPADVRRVLDCDLLILDDLGTEMTTPLAVSSLYEILNTRLLSGRSTIVNTNLEPSALSRRYSPQIASRMEGEYRVLPFFGEDIRLQKRRRG